MKSLSQPVKENNHNRQFRAFQPDNLILDSSSVEFPDPKKVLKQSLMIPGWGQVTNKQIWKVPIVYGLLGGLTYYSIQLHSDYKDYRAAYYNLNPNTPDDLRFGPTPGYIPQNSSLEALRQNRNFYRNRRDLVYVFIGLSYALNAIDAYVFAHLRSFDVSDDLSLRTNIEPVLIAQNTFRSVPTVLFTINF
ncbi:DUF5683 domain-containing protein [Gracilimonas sp. Q87]|uniref:DUF5683 domain-containing protein n=1 Tax=Gracilimonas sp. Q87 TaxID=3384766 RepID=UPI0039844E63